MNEHSKRILTVAGTLMTAIAIALSMLAFVAINAYAATGTGMPSMSDIIPGEDGTSVLPLPEGGNVDSDDVLTPDDTTRTPMTILPEPTSRPDVTSAPGATNSPGATNTGDGTDSGMTEDDGGGIMGAIIAVIVVVAIILVVIALIPRKKK